MADLQEDALHILREESAAAFTQHAAEIRANASNTNNLARLSSVRQFDEPSPARARSINKILALPKLGGQ